MHVTTKKPRVLQIRAWKSGVLGTDTSTKLQNTVFSYFGNLKYFAFVEGTSNGATMVLT